MPMMTPSGGGFPWLVVVVPAAVLLLLIVVLVALRLGVGSGRSSARDTGEEISHPEDPMAILRERLAQGDIDLPEFERRVEGLLRSDPAERITWIASTAGAGDGGERAPGVGVDLGAPFAGASTPRRQEAQDLARPGA